MSCHHWENNGFQITTATTGECRAAAQLNRIVDILKKKINKVHVLEWLSKSCDPKRIQMLFKTSQKYWWTPTCFVGRNHLKLFQDSMQTSTGDILCCGWCWWRKCCESFNWRDDLIQPALGNYGVCSVKTWKVYCCVPILDGVCL